MAREQATVGETRTIKLVNLKIQGTRITSVTGGESVTYAITTSPTVGAGTTLASGSGTYDTNRKIWSASVTMPATAQTIYVHWTVVKSGNTRRFKSIIEVTD